MAIRWKNIKTGEELVAETEPQIAALLNSSDRSPNAFQGQDFGWRLAPAIAVEVKRIRQDFGKLSHIAQLFSKAVEDIRESDILKYISDRTTLEAAPVAQISDYQDDYDAEVRRLERAGEKPVGFDQEEQVTPSLSSMSDDELEAELARRRELEPTTTTTTTLPQESTTTTTTTEMVE